MAGETQLISIQSDDLQQLRGRLSAASRETIALVEEQFDRYGAELADAVRNEVPVRSGELRDSVRYFIRGSGTKNVELQVVIGNKQRPEVVVKSLLFGSLPHEIRPKKRGGVLAFEVGGEMVFARKVNHPGTTRDPFFARALRATDSTRRSMIARIGALIVAKIEG